jgi:hypothetical protein
MIASTLFELLFGEKAQLPAFPNENIEQLHYNKFSAAECFNLLQKLRKKAHQFAIENGEKTKLYLDKTTSAHKFKIGDKVLIANDF